jgi:hypothetical protein|nr:MAG TPA: hypothetical protein [Caudoviricetes sp.]
MKIVSLRVNGYDIDGLDNATVKITLNNISPVTMTGDSVAFSATVKVPRTPNNDRTFIGLNKGLLNCEYYVAEVLIASIPFKYYAYVSDEPTPFYAKVSASQTEYTINLIESTDKWADVSLPISAPPVYGTVQDGALPISAADLSELVRRYVTFPQITFPAINPEYSTGMAVPDALSQQASIIVKRRDLTWQGDVATGSTKLVPQNYTKGRGGYVYPKKATIVMDNTSIYVNASYFGNGTGGITPGFLLSAGQGRQIVMIIEYVGASIPTSKPPIQLRGVASGLGRSLAYSGQISDRIWIYTSALNVNMTMYPKTDSYMKLSATIRGVTRDDYFKFPDGYSPEEVINCGDGKIIYDLEIAPASQTVYSQPADFPYNDVKKLVDDMCTAWHWRKIYRNGTLRVEPIVDADLRDGTSDAWSHIHDWSDKLRSVETVDVPDEFADQYVCSLDATQFSYSNGAGTVTPVKDAYKSGVKFTYDRMIFPKLGLTSVFTTPSPSLPFIYVGSIYYSYINRHFGMFRSRVQVKIKAQLEYADVENLRLGDAYYFSQLNSCFYIKSLGEYDVATGNCKLSLYKMDLK